MALTVGDILNFGGLLGSTVIAGEEGLDRNVESVSVLEIADSSISRWVEPNQLYITSFYAIWDDVEQQKIVIEELMKNGCCGLVLCNVGLLMQKVDEEVLNYCDAMQFPLIRARANVSYIDIMSPIMGVLFEDKEAPRSRLPYDGSEPLQNAFLNMILKGDRQEKILREMNQSLGIKISYYDTFGKLIYSDETQEAVQEESDYLRHNYNHVLYSCREKGYAVLEERNRKKLFVQIRAQQSMFGLFITDYDDSFGIDFIEQLMSALIMPCALLFGREDRIIDYHMRLRDEFITDLITGNFTTVANDLRRARDLHINIEELDHLMILNVNTVHRTSDENLSRDIQSYIEKNLLPQIEAVLSRECYGSWCEYRSDVIIVFISSKNRTADIERIAERLLRIFLDGKVDLSVSVGISNEIREFQEIPTAYTQAYSAAILGRNYYGTEKIIAYDQVWLFQQLQKMGEQEEGIKICQEILEPLIKYDQQHETQLLKTTYVLLHNNCNIKDAAQQLYVHKNTMLQRKNKIVEILGYSPYEMPNMLSFLMAFEVLGLSETMEG